ncbi:MAG TPA: amino acid permease [Gemmataceae bacterium]|nr:amino acid permease [Gemmataceae bacterium]
MGTPQDPGPESTPPSELDLVVREVLSEAHLGESEVRPEDREYLKQHALKKPMGVLHVWALGVGVVITGEYFGWNQGLKEGGPLGMLLASLFVCALYMMWVLALSELSVAMPFAGGPLAYGRRAVGPTFGFVMGWSMFLEALFATIGTALATGGYIYFVLNLFLDGLDAALTTTIAGLATVAVFALVQWVGSKRQAQLMEWMTYGAIIALVWFWVACIPAVRLERIFTEPLLTEGWSGVLKAIPYAIWWLVMIETVALAPEEAHEPHRTIPRGLTLAQITLIVLVLLTWFFASAAGEDYKQTGGEGMSYPLPFVYGQVWPRSAHLIAFSVVAIFGMIVSYNGMVYAVSRQSFALGRAGYLPRPLGHVHPVRRTPDVSILVWSLVVAGFVVWGYFNSDAVQVAVLTCNLTALVWYVLAMVCLFILRRRDPHMPRLYKVPFYPVLPALVLVMSMFAAAVYGWLNKPVVLWLTLILYGVGLAYYLIFARGRLISAAPEELAARAGHEDAARTGPSIPGA